MGTNVDSLIITRAFEGETGCQRHRITAYSRIGHSPSVRQKLEVDSRETLQYRGR